MKPDELEQQLQQLQMRPVPSEWREEILAGARAAAHVPSRTSQGLGWRVRLASLYSRFSFLLWPSPRAWVGLAAIWFVIGLLNFSTSSSVRQTHGSSNAVQFQSAMKEQEQLLTELVGDHQAQRAPHNPPKAPPPRSEMRPVRDLMNRLS